jgi:hypothetical protein
LLLSGRRGAGSSTIAHNVASTIARAHRGDVISRSGPAVRQCESWLQSGPDEASHKRSTKPAASTVLLERLLTKCGDHPQSHSRSAQPLAQSCDIERTPSSR